MKLTDEQITDNWQKLLDIVETSFTGERKENLLAMYEFFQDRMLIAPASGLEHYHNCFEGGYVDHVIRVVECAKKLDAAWNSMGAQAEAYTQEELIFAALHHDLGKVGDRENPYYVPNPSEWHRKNQGLIYKHNPKLEFMTVTDRALYILQHFGVKLTNNEYIGLRLTDGMYEEANKSYYIAYQPERQLRTNIAYILHQADMMATHIEKDFWVRGDYMPKPKKEKVEQSNKANQAFKELFGD